MFVRTANVPLRYVHFILYDFYMQRKNQCKQILNPTFRDMFRCLQSTLKCTKNNLN